jgi:hypothetical protein
MLEALKVLCLFLTVFFTVVNALRATLKQEVPLMNFIFQALGITGFVYIQWLM